MVDFTSSREIKIWFESGVSYKQKYMIVATDTFDWSNYPIYTMSIEETKKEYEKIMNASMSKVMEIYDLSADMNEQLNQKRAWVDSIKKSR